jgi:hypothetical protein
MEAKQAEIEKKRLPESNSRLLSNWWFSFPYVPSRHRMFAYLKDSPKLQLSRILMNSNRIGAAILRDKRI